MLTLEQQQALDRLFAQVEGKQQASAPDFLQTWLGLSAEELQQKVQQIVALKDGWQAHFLSWAESQPLEASYGFLGSVALAFYQAEKGVNPLVDSYVDAFYFIASSVSEGDSAIEPVTQAGKAIAALAMLVGQPLAERSLNRPAQPGA